MIDPTRLTEADKGREIRLIDEHRVGKCHLVNWHETRLGIVMFADSERYGRISVLPHEADFANGTYQDGGAE